jgi:DNA-binding NarL/FixJ family response regulator
MGIQVLICDDHQPFREGLHTLLDTEPDVTVIGEAVDGRTAIHAAATLQPDVILMDLNMPGTGGIEATRQVLQTSPHISILVLTMSEDDDSVFAALQAGARGYLLKGARKADIVHAIRGVDSGGAIFGPTIAKKLMTYFTTPPRPAAHNTFPQLTSREHEILVLIAAHLTNPEIASKLGLKPKTVRNHVSNIFTKMQVATRAQAIINARDAGLG